LRECFSWTATRTSTDRVLGSSRPRKRSQPGFGARPFRRTGRSPSRARPRGAGGARARLRLRGLLQGLGHAVAGEVAVLPVGEEPLVVAAGLLLVAALLGELAEEVEGAHIERGHEDPGLLRLRDPTEVAGGFGRVAEGQMGAGEAEIEERDLTGE